MRIPVVISLLLASAVLQGQSEFAKELTIGNSLTILGEDRDDRNFTHTEFTYAKNLAISITPRFDVGLNWLSIWSRNRRQMDSRSTHNIVGLFLKYNLVVVRDKFKLGPELGFNYGNYCTCGNFVPYKLDNLFYFNWGLFYETHLFSRLYLDLAFNTNLIINEVEFKYGYTQYVVGLNYKLGTK